MDPVKYRRSKEGPEAPIKRAIKRRLEAEGWYVVVTHGNAFQSGLPDLYCVHRMNGQRWVEVKNPAAYHFTNAQLEVFPEFAKRGVGVWVLFGATDADMKKLLRPPNYHVCIGHSKRPPEDVC